VPLVGTGLVFVHIEGVDTSANNGDVMACTGCTLNFTTGANVQEGPAEWIWGGGGRFTLTGSVPDSGLANAVLPKPWVGGSIPYGGGGAGRRGGDPAPRSADRVEREITRPMAR
jgi:hypothetical protein